MYVNGDLVQQSTSKMPRKSNTIKYHCKFKQKSVEGSSEEGNQSQFDISALRIHHIHPNNKIDNMLSQCDISFHSSEYKLQRILEIKKGNHIQCKQKRHKTRKRYEKIFHKNRYWQTFKEKVSSKSSMSITFSSMRYSDQENSSCGENMHSVKGSTRWEKRKKQEEENELPPTYKLFLDLSFVSDHPIHVNTGFEPR